jgi:hypothetical protein
MAESIVIVCDGCGTTPAVTVRITANGRNYAKDLCKRHLGELLEGSHAPQRGRPRASSVAVSPTSAGSRRGRPAKASTTPAQPKRRGRPPKAAPSVPAASGRKRGPITDPVLLQKRRDALAKARAARAAKRAAAR